MNEANLFLLLGKYVRRQNENLLTQSLAGVFNHCEVFRGNFLKLLDQRSPGIPLCLCDAHCVTQSNHRLKNGRIQVDLKLCRKEDPTPKYLLEAKLEAPLSPKQAKRYAEFLKSRRGKSRLGLITVHGVDAQLKKLLPKETIWLTWTEIAELANQPASDKKAHERFLCEQFYEMLKERGIPMAQSITSGDYKKLTVLDRFVTGKYRSLTKGHIDSLNSIMARMRIFAEGSWRQLADKDYRSYDKVYHFDQNTKSAWSEIEVGFYWWRAGKIQRYLYLGIDCSDPKLYVCGGWKPGDDHEFKILKEWGPKESCHFFKISLSEAQALIQTDLDKCFLQFTQSRYSRQLHAAKRDRS